MQPPNTPPLLTTEEAASYLRYRTASGIRMAVVRGLLHPVGVGPRGTHLFTVDELHRFISDRKQSYGRGTAETAGEKGHASDESVRNSDQVPRRVRRGRTNAPAAGEGDRPP